MSSPVRFDEELRAPFDLSGDRERKHRQVRLDTTYDHYTTDGKKTRAERIQLRVESRPSKEPPLDVD